MAADRGSPKGSCGYHTSVLGVSAQMMLACIPTVGVSAASWESYLGYRPILVQSQSGSLILRIMRVRVAAAAPLVHIVCFVLQ